MSEVNNETNQPVPPPFKGEPVYSVEAKRLLAEERNREFPIGEVPKHALERARKPGDVDTKAARTIRVQDLEHMSIVGRSDLAARIRSRDVKEGAPLYNFLTEVLNQFAVILPHEDGDKSMNQIQYNRIKTVIMEAFKKRMLPNMEVLLNDYIVIPVRTFPLRLHLRQGNSSKHSPVLGVIASTDANDESVAVANPDHTTI